MVPLITLTTDFGSGSSYVAQLKGVIYSALPHARVVDVCHDLPVHQINCAELLVRSTAFAFPCGTVHLMVVDPGVGSARRPLAVQSRGMLFVGPDNGLLGYPLSQPGARCVHLDRPMLFGSAVSPTFHGRDIFAPVACELAGGVDLEQVGSPINDPLPSTLPQLSLSSHHVVGQTLGADRFGNVLTNIPARLVQVGEGVQLQGQTLRWVRTYQDAEAAELVALTGSDGYLEVALRQSSAAALLGRAEGLQVRCTRSNQ